ncbi:hypothetical protein JW960_01425 [candidate division KSB1 bacterium]|nr:hypothetical protein [candidate division KSB1 bacterium]
MSKLKEKYLAIPEQIRIVTVLFAIFLIMFIFGRRLFIPKTFGEYGHYRAAAVDDIMQIGLVYAGHQACAECHDDVVAEKSQHMHKHVACENCHGPGYAHTQAPDEHPLTIPTDRSYCVLCHSYNPARPTGFPQIDPVTHNPDGACIDCHQPHAPQPPEVPEECGSCHERIVRTLGAGHHNSLPCTQCHDIKQEHKITPRDFLPTVPRTREFCGTCHSTKASSAKEIRRVDIVTHGENYFCGQCHFPHNPEVKI